MNIVICFTCIHWLSQNDAPISLMWVVFFFTVVEILQLVAREINGFYAAREILKNDRID